jgi:hypothetical protein
MIIENGNLIKTMDTLVLKSQIADAFLVARSQENQQSQGVLESFLDYVSKISPLVLKNSTIVEEEPLPLLTNQSKISNSRLNKFSKNYILKNQDNENLTTEQESEYGVLEDPNLPAISKKNNIKESEIFEMPSRTPKLKKSEAKEAARTYGTGWRKGALPKGARAGQESARLHTESVNPEVETLKLKNEEYRKALNLFKDKLNEVAVFNSNLAYATRLFTEHSTSKQEKINILRRFDSAESLKESKALYKTIKEELGSKIGNNSINESIERIIEKEPQSGSAINLIESKTYENPQFLRMKDIMSKIIK